MRRRGPTDQHEIAGLAMALLLLATAPGLAQAPRPDVVAPEAPQAAGRGGLMVFVCQTGDQWDLYSWVPSGGSPPQRLTSTPHDELSPSLSADRRLVAYTDSTGAVWLLDLKTGDRQRLSTADEENRLLQPAMAPDGRTVLAVYRAERSRDETDLVARLTPGTPDPDDDAPLFGPAWEPLAGGSSTWRLPMLSSQFSPTWAPDGRRFAFTNLHSRWTGTIISEIWEARVDHSVARQLTLLDGFCDEPSWSPTGDEIAFACDQPDQFDLYTVSTKTREVRRLTDHPASDSDPAYGPDGTSLVFVSTRDGAPALFLLDIEGGGIERLHPFPDGDRQCKEPDWR